MENVTDKKTIDELNKLFDADKLDEFAEQHPGKVVSMKDVVEAEAKGIPKKALRIWWNSNFGHTPFIKEVKNIKEAKYIIRLLTQYDLYLGDKIDANACGMENIETIDGVTGWFEWYDEQSGMDINEIMDEEDEEARDELRRTVDAKKEGENNDK